MNILINIILAFYPATLIWNAFPHSITSKGEFFSLAIIYLMLFAAVYFVVKKFTTSGYLGRQVWVQVLTVIATLIIIIFVFYYTILPGATIHTAPSWLNHYLLQSPYNFIAILIPLAVLFLY